MESPDHFDGGTNVTKKTKQEELEVTGISRSGRVRKKSSKLTDFESPDEIDRYRKKNEPPSYTFNRPGPAQHLKKPAAKVDISGLQQSDDEDDVSDSFVKEGVLSESDPEIRTFQQEDDEISSIDSMGSPGDEEDVEESIVPEQGTTESFHQIVPETADTESPVHSSAQSLYMLEKSTKKKLIIQDGKIVGRMKAQRKDKGKTRFTAYMLWAKEIRQELMKANPELDFSQTSKKLGELWATVPFNEKYIWKRRAKRLAAKKGGSRAEKPSPVTPPVAPLAALALANKKTKSPTSRKLANKQPTSGASSTSAVRHATKLSSPEQSTSGGSRNSKASSSIGNLVSEPVVGPGLYKVVGTQPIDVAAHLKLLGESLTNVGERLKEHEGQIAVSGSLSVLLDSLLCALGPLLCLTQQVPEIDVCPPQQLTKILDNVSYIMPGF